MTPEARARVGIDRRIQAAGWSVQDFQSADIQAFRGVTIREFQLASGHGTADYVLYVDGTAARAIDAKKRGATPRGVERQPDRYTKRLLPPLPAWLRPPPASCVSTGAATRYTYGLDPQPRRRNVFAFDQPRTLGTWLTEAMREVGDTENGAWRVGGGAAMLARLQRMPPLLTECGEISCGRRRSLPSGLGP